MRVDIIAPPNQSFIYPYELVSLLQSLLTDIQPIPTDLGDTFRVDYAGALHHLAKHLPPKLIITLGGIDPTGFVPDATADVCHKLFPGFGTILRQAALPTHPDALLWRNTAGLCQKTLIINLPDSPEAIRVGLPLLFPAIPNAIRLAGGK